MAKQRIEKLRITRYGSQRHRSLAGATVIGDYIDTNGERVLTVEKISVIAPKAAKKQKAATVEEVLAKL
jgi:hypothetical protein